MSQTDLATRTASRSAPSWSSTARLRPRPLQEQVDRQGILKRLLRAGRLRVSEDVAARKHVGEQPRINLQSIENRSAADAVTPTDITSGHASVQ